RRSSAANTTARTRLEPGRGGQWSEARPRSRRLGRRVASIPRLSPAGHTDAAPEGAAPALAWQGLAPPGGRTRPDRAAAMPPGGAASGYLIRAPGAVDARPHARLEAVGGARPARVGADLGQHRPARLALVARQRRRPE